MEGVTMSNTKSNHKVVRYNKWGYIFLIPFVVVYLAFQLIPLISTIYNSFYEHYFRLGLFEVGPNWVGLENYKNLFSAGIFFPLLKNTLILWIIGFIPQIIVSLLLAAWFSDNRLNLKAAGFFKTVIYLPNLIMASAFSMLFFTLFSETGPINSLLVSVGILDKPFKFFSSVIATRSLVGLMNFLMWFGNTTILLLAGMLGIDTSLFEAAEVDGASSKQKFFKITLPLLKPILIYVMITSLIGGLQMFDVPQILTNGQGTPLTSSGVASVKTMIMYLNENLKSKNYGAGGAISVIMFIVTGILSLIVFYFTGNRDKIKKA
jgi:multiple sugar transport system permease protein